MSNHHPMSLSEELSSFYGPDTTTNTVISDAEAREQAAAASHRSIDEWAKDRAQSDYMNSHTGHMYSESGQMHFTVQPDTVLNFGNGIETTVSAAVAMGVCPPHIAQQAGLTSAQPHDDLDHSDDQEQISDAHWDSQLVHQTAYAQQLVGGETFDRALSGDEGAMGALASKAGCTVEDVAELVEDTMSSLGRDVVNYAGVEGLDGKELYQFERYLMSDKVSLSDYHSALLGARSGNFSAASKLVDRFKVALRLAQGA